MRLNAFAFAFFSVFQILSFFEVFGQGRIPEFPIDSVTHKILYSEVVTIDSNITKPELYSKVQEWFAKTYNSSKAVIQLDDKENGKILGKAHFPVFMTTILGSRSEAGDIAYSISIQVKNGRYKYEITDFYHTGSFINSSVGTAPDGGACETFIDRKKGFWGNSYAKTYGSYLFQLDQEIRALIDDLKKSLATRAKKEDW